MYEERVNNKIRERYLLNNMWMTKFHLAIVWYVQTNIVLFIGRRKKKKRHVIELRY